MKYLKSASIFILMILVSLMVSCKNDNTSVVEEIESKVKANPANYKSMLNKLQVKKLGKYSLRGAEDGDGPTFRDSLSNAINLSVTGKYDEAKQAFLALLYTNPKSEEVLFQIAIQDFYLGNYSNSIKRLNQVVKSSNQELRHEAEMILAQASLSIDDGYATSKKWLSKIAADPKSPYFKDAQSQIKLFE